ncbi:MAG TPA: hypothetical protein VLA74_03355 [Nitrososphaeraceae archaeon]|nr:hypothetical protein [Nitrososphaeraceae archaeon]
MYIKKRLDIKDEKEIRKRVELIANIAKAEYYEKVRKTLPEIIDIAVNSAIGPKETIPEKDYDILVEKSLKEIKRLMIFYTLAEDKIVVKTLIRSKLREKMFYSKTFK